jgi:predicted CoA-binding protein
MLVQTGLLPPFEIRYGRAMTSPYSDTFLRDILRRTQVIALVGVSANPVRASNFVARYLGLRGYRVLPINPAYAGQTLFGETVKANLSELEAPVDMVDIFRRSEAVPEIAEDAMRLFPALRTIWMQFGVQHPQTAVIAEARGFDVVQNRCPKIEYQRLFGELRRGGFNTGIISSKLVL